MYQMEKVYGQKQKVGYNKSVKGDDSIENPNIKHQASTLDS